MAHELINVTIQLGVYNVYADQPLGAPVHVGVVAANSPQSALDKALEAGYHHSSVEVSVHDKHADYDVVLPRLFVVKA